MNRESLEQWLKRPSKTWRWNAGSRDGYEAVEATTGGLHWYRWSHLAEGGRHDEMEQSLQGFRKDGPLRSLPDSQCEELGIWIEDTLKGPSNR